MSADDELRCLSCGGIHPGARLVCLPDGREVGNYSEAYRRYWEARWVFRKYRTKRTRQEYLRQVADVRGESAKNELYNEMLRIHLAKKENE